MQMTMPALRVRPSPPFSVRPDIGCGEPSIDGDRLDTVNASAAVSGILFGNHGARPGFELETRLHLRSIRGALRPGWAALIYPGQVGTSIPLGRTPISSTTASINVLLPPPAAPPTPANHPRPTPQLAPGSRMFRLTPCPSARPETAIGAGRARSAPFPTSRIVSLFSAVPWYQFQARPWKVAATYPRTRQSQVWRKDSLLSRGAGGSFATMQPLGTRLRACMQRKVCARRPIWALARGSASSHSPGGIRRS